MYGLHGRWQALACNFAVALRRRSDPLTLLFRCLLHPRHKKETAACPPRETLRNPHTPASVLAFCLIQTRGRQPR